MTTKQLSAFTWEDPSSSLPEEVAFKATDKGVELVTPEIGKRVLVIYLVLLLFVAIYLVMFCCRW